MQQKVRFQIEGMTCQACASRIEKVLNKKDFVESRIGWGELRQRRGSGGV